MSQGLQLNVWLSVALVAFTIAQILLRRTRQALERSQPAPYPHLRPVRATIKDTAGSTSSS